MIHDTELYDCTDVFLGENRIIVCCAYQVCHDSSLSPPFTSSLHSYSLDTVFSGCSTTYECSTAVMSTSYCRLDCRRFHLDSGRAFWLYTPVYMLLITSFDQLDLHCQLASPSTLKMLLLSAETNSIALEVKEFSSWPFLSTFVDRSPCLLWASWQRAHCRVSPYGPAGSFS